jgi:DNA-binding MarR family transcriptional regulator
MHAMRHRLMVGCTVKKEMVITPSQGFVLRFVAKSSTTNVKAITQALNISSSAATQLVDGLVDNGYLLRQDNPDDRRIITLLLSDKAKKFFKEFEAQRLQKMMEIFDSLTDEELIQYGYLNQKLIDSVSKK